MRDLPATPDLTEMVLSLASGLPDPYDIARAMAWCARWIGTQSPSLSDVLRQAVEASERIGEPWARTEARFTVARILAPVAADAARNLIEKAEGDNQADALARPLLGPGFADAVGLAIIALPSSSSPGRTDQLTTIESLLESIPAPGVRADMLGRLAAREFLAGDNRAGKGHAETSLRALDASLDEYSRRSALSRIAGPVASYDLGELRDRLRDQPRWAISTAVLSADELPVDPSSTRRSGK